MAAPPRRPPSGPIARLWQSENGVLAAIVGGVVLGLCLLGLVAAATRWLAADEIPNAPHWLTTDVVKATTRDGQAVRARMAMDAPESDTRDWINSQQRQVALVMQVSVSHYDGREATGSARVQALADEMEERLNDVLQASGVPPVRDVVIQDFVISKP